MLPAAAPGGQGGSVPVEIGVRHRISGGSGGGEEAWPRSAQTDGRGRAAPPRLVPFGDVPHRWAEGRTDAAVHA